MEQARWMQTAAVHRKGQQTLCAAMAIGRSRQARRPTGSWNSQWVQAGPQAPKVVTAGNERRQARRPQTS
eukprot:365595-Chlamydomonas_euryale.AAC.8